MSLIISLFGIANSLFLSIHERTRELGLLRAIGPTAEQVRRLIRGDRGPRRRFALPFAQLAFFLLLAIGVGVAAAWLPARRAARLDILEAVATE